MKNGDPESVPSTFNCFVAMIDWDRRWRKFENGDEPIAFARMPPEKWVWSGSDVCPLASAKLIFVVCESEAPSFHLS